MDLTTQKLELIEWLIQLKDKSLIDNLNTIKDSISSDTDWRDELTDDQKASIERGMKDIEEGRFHTHEFVKKKYERYL